ncbi:hypothetical protein T02_5018 [Trichinella nativa]|uniref:Uncharacterized protein n=1 Tax=Trichinella nativa TaxID=6335 RepID=A0A0V1KSQ5_9BILA|nr:hypothetical protein T02_5018 [Trichinella nativa]
MACPSRFLNCFSFYLGRQKRSDAKKRYINEQNKQNPLGAQRRLPDVRNPRKATPGGREHETATVERRVEYLRPHRMPSTVPRAGENPLPVVMGARAGLGRATPRRRRKTLACLEE